MTASSSEIAGCLLGGALGDAVGGPYEGREAPSAVTFDPATAAVSDDTVLTLATCEGLIAASGRVDPAIIAEAYVDAWRRGDVAGVGASTLGALRALAAGAHWAVAGHAGEFAAGAGAAMRVAPLAFVIDARTDEGRRALRDVVRITHKNDEAFAGALAVMLAVQFSRTRPAHEVLDAVAAELPDSLTKDALGQRGDSLERFAQKIGTSGFAGEAVPVALVGACIDEPPLAVIERLVRCGGDTDTIASIAGQVIGARVGREGLPGAAALLPCASVVLDVADRLSRSLRNEQGPTAAPNSLLNAIRRFWRK